MVDPADTPTTTNRLPWLALIVVVVSVVVLETIPLPSGTRLWREIENAGHVPLFGLVAIALLWVLSGIRPYETGTRSRYYLAAFAMAAALGGLTELLQMFGTRDPDPWDFLRDVIGAGSFLGFYLLFDGRMTGNWRKTSKAVVLLVCLGALLGSFVPLSVWAAAFFERNHSLPQIAAFDSYLHRMFWVTQDADLTVVALPNNWAINGPQRVARLTLTPARYPGIWLLEPYPDWTGHEYLRFDVYSEMRAPIRLVLRVHDNMHNSEYADRFNYTFTVSPGANSLRIPIDAIRMAPSGRELDMRNIAAMALFAVSPKQPYVVDVDRFWLE
jgi:hypothetical protein